MDTPQHLLLASGSPRRRELLGLLGYAFGLAPANVDESQLPGEPAQVYVRRMAQTKAAAASQRARANGAAAARFVIAADTIVVDEGDVLGKPADAAEARLTLQRLRQRTHAVLTALSVVDLEQGTAYTDLCRTEVPMRAYSDQEIEAYIASGDPFDKAGAYAIQHAGFHPVTALDGCYANVVGLPLCHLTRTLRRAGLAVDADVPAGCQAALDYACPVFTAILNADPAGAW